MSNGIDTSFWRDRWLSAGRLSDMFPRLLTHTVNENVTVAQVVTNGLESHLTARLSVQAASELVKIIDLLAHVSLRGEEDQRLYPNSRDNFHLSSADAYAKLKIAAGSARSNFANFVWRNRAPPRVQFFGWLLVQERIQSRANLVRKHIVESSLCELCGQVEDCDHIIFQCRFASHVWRSLGFQISGASVKSLWTVARSATVPNR